jgi:endoglucanase
VFDVKAHLKTLVETHAPSGYEEPIRNVIRQEWAGLVDEMETDGLGSLIGIKRATNPLNPPRRIMLAAHMDEIGMMVRDVVDGFIYVHRISGVDSRIMLSQPVMVHGKRSIPGIVASVPPHLLTNDQRTKYPSFDELIIDVGLPAAEVADLVHIGDLITPDALMIDLNGTRVAGKAMDDRSCVAAVTVCLNELKSLQHQWDVYAVATVQEETGLFGAATSAYKIQPDLAIALDVTFASQPGVDSDTGHDIGGGPVVSMGPNFHTRMVEQIKEVARRNELKYQEEVIPGASGTDAWSIQVAREGIPTALLGIAIRNMHSPIETLDLKDITRTGRLMAQFIASLDGDFLATIDWDDLKAKAAE